MMKIEIKKVADLSHNIDRDIKIFPKKVIIIDKQRKKNNVSMNVNGYGIINVQSNNATKAIISPSINETNKKLVIKKTLE